MQLHELGRGEGLARCMYAEARAAEYITRLVLLFTVID